MSKTVTTKAMAKVAAVAAGLAVAASALTFAQVADAAALTQAQVSAIVSLLQSFGADATTIANVEASLTGGTVTTGGGTTTSGSCTFTRDLTNGVSGSDVTCLQQALIAAGYSIPAGATGYFGAQTTAAVAAWQKANGISPAAGYFGPISQSHWNLGGGTTTGGGSTGGGTVTGNGLKVMLSPTSPNGTVLVQGQGIGDLGDFVFSNPTGSSITVTGLTFNRIGVSNDATINNVYLYNGVNRITDSAGVSSSQFSFNNAAGLFTVLPGQTYTVSVRADIATGTSGQQIGASLVSVASTGTLDSSDVFPINSGYQTISAATLAVVNFASGDTYNGSVWTGSTLPSGATTISPQTGYTLWQNTVSISQNPVWLRSMKFTNLGSIDSTSVQNLTLYVDGTQVGTAVPTLAADRSVTFDLSASSLELNTGSHVIRVAGDIVGGSSRTIQLSLQYSSDAMFVDSQLNQPVTPEVNSTNFSAVSASPITVQSVGTSGVSVTLDPNSATNDVAVGATSQNLATFDMLAAGENTKVQDLYVCATVSGSGAGTGEGLQNGKIYFNGVQVGSTKNLPECGTIADFSLGSSLILPAGQTSVISIYADAQTATTSVANGNSIKITLKQGSSNAQGQSSLTSTSVPANDISGNDLSVTSSTLTATKATGYGDQAVVAGTNAAKIGSFVLQAGSTGSLNVNSIGIKLGGTGTSTLQNLKLVDESTGAQLGTTQTSPGTPASGNVVTYSTNFTLGSSQTKTIDVYADIPSGTSNNDTIQLSVSNAATNATDQNGQSTNIGGSDVTLQTITVGTGTFSVSIGAGNPVAANVVAGASNLEVADYTFSANTASYNVKKLELTTATSSAVNTVTIQYKDQSGATQTATAAIGSGGKALFSNLTMYVPAGNSADLTVWVSTPTIVPPGSISGSKIAFSLVNTDGTNVQIQPVGGAVSNTLGMGSDLSSAQAGYGFLVLRKSVPTFAGQSSSQTAAPNTSTVLYQFTVSADPAGAVDFNQFAFNVATSGSNANLKDFYLYDSANPSIALNGSAVNPTYGTGLMKVSTTNVVQIPAGGSKTFILKASTGSFGNASSMSINLAPADVDLIANTQESSVTGNYVWTDRAANSDSNGTGVNQWTNGFLLRDLVDGTYSFTTSS
ncbi:MAG TPA: peptidoglycan-binding domain-containing protein [Candidatus Paceibacterota bacterium]|nr:peptidoglycan-binding domain-containing protein [Candidatus Paceibacterota bacterium]